jgi:hypothetical protein
LQPSLLAVVPDLPKPKPPSPVKPVKPVKFLSAYAGTTLADFGEHEPLVREVLACDSFGVESKAFAKALEALAMWRALHGETAFAHGLSVAAGKRCGHRYVGGVVRSFAPAREATVDVADHQPENPIPTRVELVAAGVLPPVEIPPWERPPNHPKFAPRPASV